METYRAVAVNRSSHVAGLTPAGTSGVTDDPILGDAYDTPAHNSDGMVVLRTAPTVKQATFIVLEGLTNLNIGNNGARSNGGLCSRDT